ncbi:hypothetical protein DPMN_069753 [Dreissena polymorpha]|uniref:Large ribosomal subunit protein mL53 n=1 Tax=Dreissena polymorpha TaxID=45954 RepID=A0A9D3Z4W9_DREPO|nr:hypothetical protein DPMN_069753 [Dreissena polymorpha]
MKFSFDPYEPNTFSIRDCLSILTSKSLKREATARVRVDIKSDRSRPHIDVEFNDGHQLILKTEYLKSGDILEKMDKFCKAKDTSQGEADIALTKMAGKQQKKKK